MIEYFRKFLYTCDLIGTNPQLFIFNNKRYKSIFSSLSSFLIILCSIGFAIDLLIEYLKYKNPSIIYSKYNDETERRFLLENYTLAFQLVDSIDTFEFNTINNSIGYYQATFNNIYNNGTIETILLNIEQCEFGKNLDIIYKDKINNNTMFGRTLEEFYCLNTKDTNLSFFYHPNVGFSVLTLYVIFKNNSIYTPEKLHSLIVSENNIIDHYDKKNPIKKGYIFQFTGAYNSFEFTKINYNLQYIKYESDDGLFYNNSKLVKGITFSDMITYRNNNEGIGLNKYYEKSDISIIGAIGIRINQSNFDSYKRTYQRLQSLLAEVMSVINLLFEIGRQLSNILCNKKMCKDIIENLINKNRSQSLQNNKINKLIKNNEIKDLISERKEIKDKLIIALKDKIPNKDKTENDNEIKLDKSNENKRMSKIKIVKKVRVNNKIMQKINYYHILKSFLCFEDKKTKLINLCHNIVTEDMSIERILERFYNLEKIYHLLPNEEKTKFKFINNNRLKEVNQYIYTVKNDNIKKNNINAHCNEEERRNKNNFLFNEKEQDENTSIKLNLK